jgi:putative ABC transport system substrate-binding protein
VRRREFITLVGGTAAWPLAARAQQGGSTRSIGLLMAFNDGDDEGRAWAVAFQKELEKFGWFAGRNIRIDYGWAGGDAQSRAEVAKKLLERQPELVVTQNTPTTQAVLQQSQTIPIIFANVADPVGGGFVANFSRPGGNITGFANFEGSLGGKWLELLTEIAPSVRRVATLFNPTTAPFVEHFFLPSFKAAAERLSVEAVVSPVRDVSELKSSVATLAKKPNGGLIPLPETFVNVHRLEVLSLAADHRLPAVYGYSFYAKLGGLLSFGPDPLNNFRRVTTYVDRVLRGERPIDLPVQAPDKYNLVINKKTANSLGLTVPPSLMVAADEVIE